MPGTDTPRLFQGAFRQLNKFFVVISVNLYLTRGHYISVGGTGIQRQLEMEYSQHELYKIKKSKETIKRHLLIE